MKIPSFVSMLLFTVVLSGQVAFAQSQGSIANVTFTSNVVEEAPVDFRQQFTNSTPAVYFYCKLQDLVGQHVKMRWSLEGKQMQETVVKVTRAQQPAWSMMKMQPQWTGDWTVEVLDTKGQVIGQQNFAFSPPL